MSTLIADFKCEKTICYFHSTTKINKCKCHIGIDAGQRVKNCEDRTAEQMDCYSCGKCIDLELDKKETEEFQELLSKNNVVILCIECYEPFCEEENGPLGKY